jgi:hypothetical protein
VRDNPECLIPHRGDRSPEPAVQKPDGQQAQLLTLMTGRDEDMNPFKNVLCVPEIESVGGGTEASFINRLFGLYA